MVKDPKSYHICVFEQLQCLMHLNTMKTQKHNGITQNYIMGLPLELFRTMWYIITCFRLLIFIDGLGNYFGDSIDSFLAPFSIHEKTLQLEYYTL